MTTHDGVKPFKCEICEKNFARSDSLSAHMTKHAGVKPFKCEICEKHFTRSSGLSEHIKKIHKEK